MKEIVCLFFYGMGIIFLMFLFEYYIMQRFTNYLTGDIEKENKEGENNENRPEGIK